jgi:hypothetical protein
MILGYLQDLACTPGPGAVSGCPGAAARMSVAAASVGSMEEDGKRKPFNETGLYKAITLTVLTPVTAGVAAVGGVTTWCAIRLGTSSPGVLV